jgi:flavin-dependent dehydrogenase
VSAKLGALNVTDLAPEGRLLTKFDVIVVGGGPAGSSCAWQLRRRGVKTLILDKASFPRLKLCAGWITPEVVADLEMDVASYPHRFLTFDITQIHIYGLTVRQCSPQHSIRRYEFDDWLLRRSGVPVKQHNVKRIAKAGDRFVIDDTYECAYLVGAGGTGCPVYRNLFRKANPRAKLLQAVALEHEAPCEWTDGDCHLWFFEKGLPGYSWYVPKQDGYLNLGVGAIAGRLKLKGQHVVTHWDNFVTGLRRRGLISDSLRLRPQGYSYYLRDFVETYRIGNAFLIGDAAGLATRDLAEGIGPAVRSGILAANAIADGTDYDLGSVSAHSLPPGLQRQVLEYLLLRRGASSPA